MNHVRQQKEYRGSSTADVLMSVRNSIHDAIANNAKAQRTIHSEIVVKQELNAANEQLRNALTALHEILARLALPRTDRAPVTLLLSAALVGLMAGLTIRRAWR